MGTPFQKRRERLKVTDPALRPVAAFFNDMHDLLFLEAIEVLSRGKSLRGDGVEVVFSHDRSPGEEEFEGVRFSSKDYEVVIGATQFVRLLRKACAVQMEALPLEREKLEPVMARIAKLAALL